MGRMNQNALFQPSHLILGFQHVLAMFGATVLVPFLTGLDPSIALLSAGLGTLVFHFFSGWKVPVFLGSSFAFIGAIALVLKQNGLPSVKSGIVVAGLLYVIMAFLVKIFGVSRVKSYFPPIVTGPIIMVIGLRLSPVALSMIGYDKALGTFDQTSLIIASSVVLTMILVSIFSKGFFKLVPILISVIIGYCVAILFQRVDFTLVNQANWFGLTPNALENLKVMPNWDMTGIIAIAPIALVVFIEHIGDITTNGAVVGKDFFKDPGIHRTLLGDGIATALAGFLGGPANTTYSENTGVLAVTKVYNPGILRIAAIYAICISFIGKFGAMIQTIPTAVMGGVSLILFGMIASVGMRTLIEAKLDFAHSRNLIISALILVCGIAIDNVNIGSSLSLSGLAIAAIIGIALNKIFPEDL